MTRKFVKIATTALLLLGSTASAFAGSVTQPGETVGIATGTPLPQGFISSIQRTGGAVTRSRKAHVWE